MPELRNMIEALHARIDVIEGTRNEQHLENQIQMSRIGAAIQHNDECIDDMKKKLFGNGQPGVIDVIQNRIGNLEKSMWRASGAIALLLTLLNAVLVIQKLLQGP